MRHLLRAFVLGLVVSAAAADDAKPLTDDECLAAARLLQQSLTKGSGFAAVTLFDWDALLDRVTTGIDADPAILGAYRDGIKAAPGQLLTSIADAVRQGGSYTLLRVHEKEGKRALFRLIMPDGAVNYHDYELVRGADGRVRFVDFYVFLSAENMSMTLRRALLPIAADASRGLIERLGTSDREFVKHMAEVQSISDLTDAGRPGDALRVYRSLPASLRQDKGVLLMRLRAARAAGQKEYEAALNDFRQYCPADASKELLAIDVCIFGKRFDEALACIDRLEAALGGDPYADVVRANVQYLKGDLAASSRLATKAIGVDPTLQPAYWRLVEISLDEKKFDETARLLIRLEKMFPLAFGDLKGIERYREFVKSAAYQEWAKRPK